MKSWTVPIMGDFLTAHKFWIHLLEVDPVLHRWDLWCQVQVHTLQGQG